MTRRGSRSSSSHHRRRRNQNDYDDEEEEEENDVVMMHEEEEDDDDDDDDDGGGMNFCSQAPELSQAIQPVKQSERQNLNALADAEKERLIVSMSRLLLFKALAGEPIDRLKCVKQVLTSSTTTKSGDSSSTNARMTSALLEEAASNLDNVFGFQLRRIPQYMERTLPNKYRDRLYVINHVVSDEQRQDQDGGNNPAAAWHSKELHSVHVQSSMERGLLMTVLALCFCKGVPKKGTAAAAIDGGAPPRWIRNVHLYQLLHSLDENIPPVPPKTTSSTSTAPSAHSWSQNNNGTPPVDVLLDKFVMLDYLLRERAGEWQNSGGSASAAGTSQVRQQHAQERHDTYDDDDDGGGNGHQDWYYTMGPRAAMEIGRRQVLFFCANVLDEAEPDPTMLEELQPTMQDDDDDDDDDDEV